jgi:hypothetical protein
MDTSLIGDNPFAPFWEKKEPDFINDEGFKWWLDKGTTKYAMRENANGTTLDYQVWVVEKPDGFKTRIILDDRRKPIYENTSLEGIAVKIDMMKLVKEKCSD